MSSKYHQDSCVKTNWKFTFVWIIPIRLYIMKKLFVFVGIVCACCFFYQPKGSKQNQVLDLMASNIECLAQGESGGIVFCYGTGSIDCKGYKVKEIIMNVR